jgi:superfamily II DNA or RNA helicase
MADIRRFSSRKDRLDRVFLADRLLGATSYKRIAGYFRSSIFELVGEEIAGIPDVRIVCNSELDAADISVSKAARESALKGLWNAIPVEVEALLQHDRYRKLYELLSSGQVQVRVVPRERVFLHGKAGVIETPQGKTAFLGSINETRNAFASNYEILWEDPSPEGVQWVEDEFDALWEHAHPLPEAIVTEIKRIADRVEITFGDATAAQVPAAALAETPLYRGGQQLQPWQRAFVALFLQHRDTYGKVRLLLADEVGLGKTLSLAASALVATLLGDGPVLILCPSTLTLQWQAEMKDLLGVPSAVWHSTKKHWIDTEKRVIRTRGARDINRCPFRIAIVSTGLVVQESEEREILLGERYGTVILDEAHKARRRAGVGEQKDAANNLLDFMLKMGSRTRHLLLGTATPIQTDVRELWDLMQVLHAGADFVLGRGPLSTWANFERALPYVKGAANPDGPRDAWELVRNPLPPGAEHELFYALRQALDIADDVFFSDKGYGSLSYAAQTILENTMDGGFFREFNPILRHTVLRKRQSLEELGLIERVRADIHPDPQASPGAYQGQSFVGLGLMTNHPFDLAYAAAERFTELLGKRTKSAGFMKSLLLQRICSSFASGRSTAIRMLERTLLEDEEDAQLLVDALDGLTPDEAACLRTIAEELSRPEARDPKFDAARYFLTSHRVEGRTWLEHGCILFSQYYDTAFWVGEELARSLPGEVIAVYAGVGKSGLFKEGKFTSADRDDIKRAVKKREIRLVVATDAACEGLNLQTLGTLINIDLPWNPSRLEQRLGRIKRFGQARRSVDMLNLVYHDTRDEKVYEVLSRRMKDRFDIFGGLPDTIEDAWIESEERLESEMDRYVNLRQKARDVFELRYQASVDPEAHRWEECSRVFGRADIVKKLSEPW